MKRTRCRIKFDARPEFIYYIHRQVFAAGQSLEPVCRENFTQERRGAGLQNWDMRIAE